MPVKQGRAISVAFVLFVLAAVGGASAHKGWLTAHEALVPAVLRRSAGGEEITLRRDTLSDRQYALDALALKYVGDYTDDAQIVEEIGRGYWCATPVLQQMGKISPSERSETALRERARSMVSRTARVAQARSEGAEPSR